VTGGRTKLKLSGGLSEPPDWSMGATFVLAHLLFQSSLEMLEEIRWHFRIGMQ
jgi:hypothetical protein